MIQIGLHIGPGAKATQPTFFPKDVDTNAFASFHVEGDEHDYNRDLSVYVRNPAAAREIARRLLECADLVEAATNVLPADEWVKP